jgi:hypothetical protein
MRLVGILLLTFVTACAAQKPAVGGLPATPTFENAYATVRSGREPTARAEGWVVEWAGEGRIRVLRENPIDVAGQSQDSTITRKVREQLSGLRVFVRTEAGVVTLRGWLGTQADAVRAIRAALRAEGVTAVDVELSFPVNEASRP